jgi:hypothetical protein
MIGGAASGMFWVLNGIYMANYCRNLAENKKGFYFSLSSVVFNARLIIAPILTIVGLGLGN